jgi:hypothetical protein
LAIVYPQFGKSTPRLRRCQWGSRYGVELICIKEGQKLIMTEQEEQSLRDAKRKEKINAEEVERLTKEKIRKTVYFA